MTQTQRTFSGREAVVFTKNDTGTAFDGTGPYFNDADGALIENSGLEEGGSVTLQAEWLAITDPDAADQNTDGTLNGDLFTFTVTATQNGVVEINGQAVDRFTLTQLRAGDVVFNHDGGEEYGTHNDGTNAGFQDRSDATPTFIKLKVTDGEGAESEAFTLTILPTPSMTRRFR